MSGGHQGQGTPVKIRKSSPNPSKQGPMKATIPISCVLKRSNIRNSISPTLSPPSYWKGKVSPDSMTEQKNTIYKAKSRTLSGSSIKTLEVMRKTVSLDSIYKWSSDEFSRGRIFQSEKNGQSIEEDVSIPEEKGGYLILRPNFRDDKQVSKSLPNEVILGEILETLSRIHTPSSLEGLNQEVASLLGNKPDLTEKIHELYQATPEGRRAPVRDLVNLNKISTPSRSSSIFVNYSPVTDSPPRDSNSPVTSTPLDSTSEPGSQTESPSQEGILLGTSPRPNQFSAHVPPPGCERVVMRSDVVTAGLQPASQIQPTMTRLKPSITSAFQELNNKTQIIKPVALTADQINRKKLEVEEKRDEERPPGMLNFKIIDNTVGSSSFKFAARILKRSRLNLVVVYNFLSYLFYVQISIIGMDCKRKL